jgi:diadenylate cyclase
MWQELEDYYAQFIGDELWSVLLEWFVLGVVIYLIWRFLRETRGARVLKGVAVVLVIGVLGLGVLAKEMHLAQLEFYTENSLIALSVALLVVFQPELRRALMRIGATGLFWKSPSETGRTIRELVRCAQFCSRNRIGALIAVEREVALGGLIESGVRIDAAVSAELLNTIFCPATVLHDMGIVIQNNRIASASVQFPLADSDELDGFDASLGSRHRSAVGLSQESDAVIIVVSEKSGAISLALQGRLDRNLTPTELGARLSQLLTSPGAASAATAKAAVL